MARTDTLGNFLTDVADAIRTKKGTTDTIVASDFDTEIESIEGGGKYAPRYISFYRYRGTELNYELENLSLENITKLDHAFDSIITIPNLDLSVLDLSGITSFSHTFANSSYQTINFGNSVPKPTTLDYAFNGNGKLTSLDISHFDCSDTNDLSNILNGCGRLRSFKFPVNLGKNTEFVNILQAFRVCYELTEIDISFITTPITTLKETFYYCSKAKRIIATNLTGATIINNMCNGCSTLEYLDIRSLDFTKVTSYNGAFNGVPTACEIIVKDDASKQWINEKFPTYTNVKTVAEYEG